MGREIGMAGHVGQKREPGAAEQRRMNLVTDVGAEQVRRVPIAQEVNGQIDCLASLGRCRRQPLPGLDVTARRRAPVEVDEHADTQARRATHDGQARRRDGAFHPASLLHVAPRPESSDGVPLGNHPGDDGRRADHQLAPALDDPQRQRRRRGDAEGGAHGHQRPLLHADTPGDHERRAARRRSQALDGQRRHPADRPPQQPKDQPGLDHLGQPGREVPRRRWPAARGADAGSSATTDRWRHRRSSAWSRGGRSRAATVPSAAGPRRRGPPRSAARRTRRRCRSPVPATRGACAPTRRRWRPGSARPRPGR